MNKINYQKPEVLVTDLYLEGVLCQSLVAPSNSIETWQVDETFTWE